MKAELRAGKLTGSGITTNISEARATVTGDPLRSERPKLAPLQSNLDAERRELIVFFEALWGASSLRFYHGLLTRDLVWQGGSLPLPWDRLEADGRSGAYCLVDRHRLPVGIECLRDPLQWDDAETMIWARALRSPDYTRSVEFQFRQPVPGRIIEQTQDEPSSRVRSTYSAEALAYSRRQILENGSSRVPWSGLPFGSSDIPVLLSDHAKEWLTKATGGDETMADLVQFAEEYETFMPYQATRADLEQAVKSCEVLAQRLPALAEEPRLLRADLLIGGLQVAEGSFDHIAILEWIANNYLRHVSGTVMGGHWGVIWIVMLILVLWSNAEQDSTRDQLRRIAGGVQTALGESTQILTATLEQRRESTATVEQPKSLWKAAPIPYRVVPKRGDAWTRDDVAVVKNPPAVQADRSAIVAKASRKRSHELMAEKRAGDVSVVGKRHRKSTGK
ncbi:hypothetical protein FRC08_004022 [Ceratobasidium sp. 394]|nr:hypothetical protein FRC08_004022 [Ceratobasidium sp. 394]